jgi:hypothetical protein
MANKWYNALATLLPTPPTPAPPAVTYLSDLNWTSATNGFGPVERDQSIGGTESDDGGAVWLNGVTYPKGLGTHAASEIVYNIGGQYARFLARVGIDDDAGSQGSAVFQVFADSLKIYDSGVMTGASATKQIDVSVAGAQQLKLVVTDGGDNIDWDHGDWANARLTTQPTVSASSFDFDDAPHELSFTFRGDVSGSLSTADLTLMNLTTNTPVPAASIGLDYNTSTNVATFTFPGFTGGILPDARYRATLLAPGITDAAGNPMPANVVSDFFYLTADANHDGTVELLDFNALSEHFGLSSQTFSTGDFNYDGVVNLSDFNLLAGKFGSSLSSQMLRNAPAKSARAALLDSLRDDLLS